MDTKKEMIKEIMHMHTNVYYIGRRKDEEVYDILIWKDLGDILL